MGLSQDIASSIAASSASSVTRDLTGLGGGGGGPVDLLANMTKTGLNQVVYASNTYGVHEYLTNI